MTSPAVIQAILDARREELREALLMFGDLHAQLRSRMPALLLERSAQPALSPAALDRA